MTDLGDNDGFAALHHTSGDAFADVITGLHPIRWETIGYGDPQFTGLLMQQGHHTGDHTMMVFQNLEHTIQGGLEVQRTGQGLTHLNQCRQLFDVTCLGRHTPRHRVRRQQTYTPITTNLLVLIHF